MAIVKEVTLTEKGLNAGPDYEIWFSANGINYIQVVGTFSLPEIGDSVTVNVADDSQYIKLINLSPTCNENEVIVPLFTTTTTTTTTLPPLPSTTTTTIAPGPTTTTTTVNPAFTSTTTFASGSLVQVIAHSCQNFYDFNKYNVPSSPSPSINGVYKDNYGTCYYITSIPTNQSGSAVGTLTYVGPDGSCTSSSCVTSTTTVAPYCNKWSVSNSTGAGYYFKYYYCGQSEATYLEVDPGQTVTVCTQNDRIYNAFNAPLTFTNLVDSCIGTTTTTTLPPDLTRVVAHACQDFYDFNTYGVNKNITPNVQINDVLKDSTGRCYYVTSIPNDQNLPVVGTLAYVGGQGACSSSQCVTTTTTEAPFCTQWKVENPTSAGYYFKYQYCGQTNYIYPEVPANSSVIVCVQNNRIYDSFVTPLAFTQLGTPCNATTTTTTTAGPTVKFVAAPCQDIYGFNTFQAASASYNLGDVFKDDAGTCYSILSFNGQVPVGTLTFVGPAGSCSSSSCVTTTTTAAPYCNVWKVENPSAAGYTFKYKYCGQTQFTFLEVPAFGNVEVCVQNDEIYDAFNTPLVFDNLGTSCIGTTTTTTTTGPKTIFTAAPCQNIADFHVFQAASASYNIGDVFIDNVNTCYTILSFNGQVPVGELTYLAPSGSNACNLPPCLTTTTTAAPYCNIWQVVNPTAAGYFIKYKYCGQNVFSFPEIPAYTTQSFCVQNDEIYDAFNTPLVFTNQSTSCIGTTTTTTTVGPQTIFTAGKCSNIADFNVFQAPSASYQVGDVFINDLGICYTLLSFNGVTPVDDLIYIAASGSNACNLPPCLTTTTTAAPYCNLWQVTNPFGTSYSFKYKYCGQTDYTYPTIGPNSSMIVCVQNDEIYNSFGAPITFDNLEASCVGTTTTTSTTTTTTLAPGCFLYDVYNYGLGSGQFRYVYCGAAVTSSVTLPSQGQTTVCVDNNKIETSYAGITWTRTTGSCAATTTTTSTTSTTTTTTQAPFSNKYSADAWFYANSVAFDVAYTASTLLSSTATISPASGNTILVGGPSFIASEYTVGDSRRSDAHFFILSGSALRTSPTQNPTTPIAKVLNVTNVTSNTVPLNYVDVSGSLIGVSMASGSTTQITSQTLPFGLDGAVLGGTAWLSASFTSDFTGSVTAYERGARFYKFTAVRTISQQETTYVTPSGSTTPVQYTLGQPVSGSSAYYRCSVTIPFVRNGYYVVNDLGGCAGNTTTTTTSTTTTTTQAPEFSNVWTAEGWYSSANSINPQTISYYNNRNEATSSIVTSGMGNTLLLGGPAFSASISSNNANVRLDVHYFAESGSSFRATPWDEVIIPKAKVLNVTNITDRTVPLNYVDITGSLVGQSLPSGSSATITSQTIPTGYDTTNGSYQYISASIVSDYTGSLTPYSAGNKWYKLTAVTSVSNNDYLYRVAYGQTTGVSETVTFPTSGSTTLYRCSRTIPTTQRGYYVVEYVTNCDGNTTTTTTTTTTTAAPTTTTTAGPTTTTTTLTPPTTTTTTTIASQNVVISNCPDQTITTPITLAVNGPRLMGDRIVKILGGFAGYDCWYVTNIAYTGSIIYTATVEQLYLDCYDCENNITTTTTTTAAPTTTTTTGGVTTTSTTIAPYFGQVYNAQWPSGSQQLSQPVVYYADCNGEIQTAVPNFNTILQFCSVWTLDELQNINADLEPVVITYGAGGAGVVCCNNITTTTLAPYGLCYQSSSIRVYESADVPGVGFYNYDSCEGVNDWNYIYGITGSTDLTLNSICAISGTISGSYGSIIEILSTGSICGGFTTTTTTTSAPGSEFIASGGFTGSFESASVTYKYHLFTGSAQFNVLQGTKNDVKVAVIAGGGGRGEQVNPAAQFGGGGGAGGAILSSSISFTAPSTYQIVIGASGSINTSGGDSYITGSNLNILATGGGYGSFIFRASPLDFRSGGNGGSGGGGYYTYGGAGLGIVGQGKDGSNGRSGAQWGGGGGKSTSPNGSENGGDGIEWGSQLIGSASYYAGGGAGASGASGLGQNNYGGGGSYGTNPSAKKGVVIITYQMDTTTTTTAAPTTTTTAGPTTTTTTGAPVTLPSGAVLVYDFSDVSSWPGSGSYVYDISGNALTGSLYGTIGSGSAGAINFLSAEARIECTSSVFNSALTGRKQLYVGVQYQTGSLGRYTSLAATWGNIGTTPDIGYGYFLSATSDEQIDTGIQIYDIGGGGPQGYYDTAAIGTFATGSSTHTYAMMANIASGSYNIYIDNTLKVNKTGLNTAKYFVYGGTDATGNGMRFGNRTGANEQFNGNFYKTVVYNRALSDSELATIESWMTS